MIRLTGNQLDFGALALFGELTEEGANNISLRIRPSFPIVTDTV